MAKVSDKQLLEDWQKFRDNIAKSTPVDLNETAPAKKKRIADLEKKPEEWFKYYFPNFYTAAPAPFHISATKRVLANPEWFEVRSWSRELAKSSRTMMEVLYLVLTGKKKNVLLVSNSKDNAERLLLPYKTILEVNNRIINDYGVQESIGNWKAAQFITRDGAAFRALGAGESPRGSRNDAFRPDVILIDDIDTDEECRNKDRIKQKMLWIMEALIPTRSVSSPLLIIACGNIIAKYCCITELGAKADKWDVVNLVDKNGISTWLKNTQAHIDRLKKIISNNSFKKEYCNDPQVLGDTFPTITYGKTPKISSCDMVVAYSDPSTSDRKTGDSKGASNKSVVIVGFKGFQYFIYWLRVNQTNNRTFVQWLFDAEDFLEMNKVDPKKIYIENNSLQNPFYEQVIKPLIQSMSSDKCRNDLPPVTPDKRKKPDKFDRIDGTLEPINRAGNLIFDEKLKGTPDMERMEEQMLAVSPNCKTMDGPDALEGGVWIIQKRKRKTTTNYVVGATNSRRY